MSRLTRDGTGEPISRDQIFRRERGQGNINFPCSADHEQDWQPYPVGLNLAICVTIHILYCTVVYTLTFDASVTYSQHLIAKSILICDNLEPCCTLQSLPQPLPATRPGTPH